LKNRSQKLLEFLERSGPSLYALLTRLTLREDVAENLMQELFIKLNSSKAFDKAKYPVAYAHRAAANLAFDWRKKHKRESLSLVDVREPASNNSSPLSRLAQKEELEEILNAIGRLSGISRETFVMRYIRQNSYEQIAQALGKDRHHVRVLCFRAMTRLRGLLERDKSQSS